MTELPILLLDADLHAKAMLSPLRGGRWQVSDLDALTPGQSCNAVVFTPAINVHWLAVPTRARETWRQACRYSLEDVIANDLDGVHVALPASLKQAQAPAAVVANSWMSEAQVRLSALAGSVTQIYPAQALLDDGEHVLLNDLGLQMGRQQGLAAILPADLAVPESFASDTQSVQDTAAWLLARANRIAGAPELLSGTFARITPKSQSRSGTWQWAAAITGLAALLLLVTRWSEVHALRQTEQRLDSQMQALLAQALGPNAVRITGSERQQIENELAKRQGGSGTGALGLLIPVAEALNRQTQVRINAFSFREGSLELTLEAPDVRSFDTLKDQLALSPGVRPSLGELSYGKANVTGRMRIEPSS